MPTITEDFCTKIDIRNGYIPSMNLQRAKELAGLVYDMIYLLTAIGLSPGGSSTVHIYTKTIHRTTQQFRKVRAVPRLG